MSTTVQINIQIERMREQQEKNREKKAREASKEGKLAASLRMVSSIVAALLTPYFTSKNHTLIFFLKKIFFVNSVKQVSANFLETAL